MNSELDDALRMLNLPEAEVVRLYYYDDLADRQISYIVAGFESARDVTSLREAAVSQLANEMELSVQEVLSELNTAGRKHKSVVNPDAPLAREIKATVADMFTATYTPLQKLRSESTEQRVEGARALATVEPSPSVVETLVQQLEDPSEEVRRVVADSVKQLCAADASRLWALRQALTDEDRRVCMAAAEVLADLSADDAATIEALREALYRGEPEVSRVAAEALGRLGADDAATTEALREALVEGNAKVRQAAAETLANLGADDPETLRSLREALIGDEESILHLIAHRTRAGGRFKEVIEESVVAGLGFHGRILQRGQEILGAAMAALEGPGLHSAAQAAPEGVQSNDIEIPFTADVKGLQTPVRGQLSREMGDWIISFEIRTERELSGAQVGFELTSTAAPDPLCEGSVALQPFDENLYYGRHVIGPLNIDVEALSSTENILRCLLMVFYPADDS